MGRAAIYREAAVEVLPMEREVDHAWSMWSLGSSRRGGWKKNNKRNKMKNDGWVTAVEARSKEPGNKDFCPRGVGGSNLLTFYRFPRRSRRHFSC